MNYIRKYLLQFYLLLILSLAVQPLIAQVKLVASANKRSIHENDFVTLQFNIENTREVEQFIPPVFRGCKIVQGPMHVTGASVINGVQRNYVSFVYVVQPLSTGRFSFTGASAKINGNRQVFNTVKVDVADATTAGSSFSLPKGLRDDLPEKQLYSDYVLHKGENLQDKIRKNLFIKVDVNTHNCYEGEPIVASYKLYTRLRSESKISRRPSFNGFSVYDMVDPSIEPSGMEKLNGRDFNVYLIRKAQLFPLQAGELELDPAEVDNYVTFLKAEYAAKDNGQSLPDLLRAFEADDVTNEGVKTERVSIKSNPVVVTVKALPETTKPASFDGAVGKFSIDAAIDRKNVTVNDAATLKVIIKGEGNFGVINAPKVKWPDAIEAYDATAKEDFLKNLVPLRGYKTFDFKFVPQKAGHMVVPPIEFSYFDPKLKQYVTVHTDSILVKTVATAAMTDQLAAAEIAGAQTPGKMLYWFIAGGVVLLGGFGWLLYRKIQSPARKTAAVVPARSISSVDTVNTRPDAAAIETAEPAYTPDLLFNVRLALIQANSQVFYSELSKAVKRATAAHLGIKADADKVMIEKEMVAKEVDEILVSQFQLIVQQCEVALYTPSDDEGDMQSAYDLAEDFMLQLKGQ